MDTNSQWNPFNIDHKCSNGVAEELAWNGVIEIFVILIEDHDHQYNRNWDILISNEWLLTANIDMNPIGPEKEMM